MSNPFLAEIRIFPFIFAPKGWAFCDGQILPISQNTALFALLGVTYGGDGKSTFALPNLQGSAPLHPGQGPGLSLYDLGESGGVQNLTLLQSELPQHSHFVNADKGSASSGSPAGGIFKSGIHPGNPAGAVWLYNGGPADTPIQGVGVAGGDLPHNNMMPYLTLNFCIALQGVFPPRS
jgi:microcystin-dependent protein